MKAGWMTMPLAFIATLAFLFAVGTSGAGVDADPDSDGHQTNIDNCPSDANADQTDTDDDGYGNKCDGDYDQDGFVGVIDFGLFKDTFSLSEGAPGYNEHVDSDANGTIGVSDFGTFKDQFVNGLGSHGPPVGEGRPCATAPGSPQFGHPSGPTTECPDPGLIAMPRATQLP